MLGGDDAIGSNSRTYAPIGLVDGGHGMIGSDKVGIPTLPPVAAQQLAKVSYSSNAPQLLTQTQ